MPDSQTATETTFFIQQCVLQSHKTISPRRTINTGALRWEPFVHGHQDYKVVNLFGEVTLSSTGIFHVVCDSSEEQRLIDLCQGSGGQFRFLGSKVPDGYGLAGSVNGGEKKPVGRPKKAQ